MSWNNPPTAFIRTVREAQTAKMASVALEVAKRLIMKTPVDTGRAKNSWDVSFSNARFTNLAPGDYDMGGGTTLAKIVTKLEGYKLLKSGKFPAIFITNGVPYIGKLNQGWSKQAPSHFVEQTLNEVFSVIR